MLISDQECAALPTSNQRVGGSSPSGRDRVFAGLHSSYPICEGAASHWRHTIRRYCKENSMASYRKRRNNNGEVVHQFQIRRKGFPKITKTFTRKTDGDAWAQDIESAMRNGRYKSSRQAQDMTVSQLIDLYVERTFHERRSKATPLFTLHWWKARIGDVAIGNVTKKIIRQHLTELEGGKSAYTKKPLSNRTINAYIETLSACFTYAVHEELLENNPLFGFKKKPLNNSREAVLSQEQLQNLLAAVEQSSNRYLKVALLMTLSTGGRRAEIMGLRWDEVDLAAGEIQFTRTKNGKKRTVVLGPKALEALREHSKLRVLLSPLVFPPLKPRRFGLYAKYSFPWEDLRSPFKRACKKAGVTGLRWHDLRHCAASYLLAAGASMSEMMKILGHQSGAMSWRYSHLDQKRTAELVGKVDSNVFSVAAA